VGIQDVFELASFCKYQPKKAARIVKLSPSSQMRSSNIEQMNTSNLQDTHITMSTDNRNVVTDETPDSLSYSNLTIVEPSLMSPMVEMIMKNKVSDQELLMLLVPILQMVDMFPKLVQILHEKCKQSAAIHNNLLWCCNVENSEKLRALMLKVMGDLTINPLFLKLFMQQSKLIDNFTKISSNFKNKIDSEKNYSTRELDRKEKIAQLRVILNSESPSSRREGKFANWNDILSKESPLTLPCLLKIDDESTDRSKFYQVVGFNARKASIFKSATSPLLIPFIKTDGDEKLFIFKSGDDMRQDRNIILLLKVMDYIWKQNDRDYQISETLYEVIPTGPTTGLMEMVPKCHPLSSIENIAEFFIEHEQASIYTYSKTLAAYCVATFLLGIGDRHFDNLLITETGHFFHIDFGFVFGDDPKPSFTIAPMRITKNMISHISNPETFFSETCTAFNILRNYATLLLNLTNIMFGEKAMKYFYHRLRMDLDDDSASTWLRGKIMDSLNSVLPEINETFHKIAQRMRD